MSLTAYDTKYPAETVSSLESNGYVVIDNYLPEETAKAIYEEMKALTQTGLMIPNRTHFSSPKTPGQHHLFSKPGNVVTPL